MCSENEDAINHLPGDVYTKEMVVKIPDKYIQPLPTIQATENQNQTEKDIQESCSS